MSTQRPPLITLTSDFGTRDPYVAEMKGVLLSEGPPHLQLVDLSHELPRHDVDTAARFLAAAVPRFPAGTVHLAVIDPGVGSARAALAVACLGQYLVLPDNGLITDLSAGCEACVAITTDKLVRGELSATFHGRDVFAPAAARLSAGTPLLSLGPSLESPTLRPRPQPRRLGDRLSGEVVSVDHFGNLRTNIARAAVESLIDDHGPCAVICGAFRGPLQDHYAQVERGKALALFDSQAQLEVAIREGSAADELACEVGAPVEVVRRNSIS